MKRSLVLILMLVDFALGAADTKLSLASESNASTKAHIHLSINSESGVYGKGDTVKVFAILERPFDRPLSIRVNSSGKRIYTNNKFRVTSSDSSVVYSGCFNEACAVTVAVGDYDDRSSFKTIGFVVSPEDFMPGFSEPKDLVEFWEKQIDKLNKKKPRVKIKEIEHEDSDRYVCYDLEISMPEGSPVRGYMAMPRDAVASTLPIVLLPHPAGVAKPHCRSSVKTAVEWAKKGNGTIALDINAHGFLNAQPQEYYDDLDATTLKDYAKRPLVSHEEFYFRLMYLRLVRAMDYLTSLPQWDGKRALVVGESQGAGQAGAIAALDHRIGMVVMNVPALCDIGGVLNGHKGGWPAYYSQNVTAPEIKELSEAILPYYDVALLLKYTKASIIMECGLIDTVCSPESVYSAYNNALNSVSKTMLTYPRRPHHRVAKPYYKDWEKKVGNIRNSMIDSYLK